MSKTNSGAAMNLDTLKADSETIGISFENDRGVVSVEGPAAEVKRAFVLQGLDTRTYGTVGWTVWDGDRYVAHIHRMPNATDYALGRLVRI